MLVAPACALALTLLASPVAATEPIPPPAKQAPPARAALRPDSAHPRLSNPQVTIDGGRAFVARLVAATSLERGVDVSVVALDPKLSSDTVHLPGVPQDPNLKLMLSPNERSVAVLAGGELWLKTFVAKDATDSNPPRRLYPPEAGDAPLGPSLTQAAFSRDSSSILVQSAKGWGQVSVDSGEYAPLPIHPVELAAGSVAFSPDGKHATFVRVQRGKGYLNGSAVIAVNLQTGVAQVLDSAHLYTEVLFLPDGAPLAKDSSGALWVLRAASRIPYFPAPALSPKGEVEAYGLSLGLTRLVWVSGGPNGDELWSAGAPPLPKSSKSGAAQAGAPPAPH